MQASRLLSILMVLQARGRVSARALAEAHEVSVRTIYRDADQLSAAGVPIYAERGRDGGFALIDGWHGRLTGLTETEAEAVFLAGLPGPAAELGIGEAMAAARLKLLASLPADWRGSAERVAGRFHLDPAPWYRGGESETLLPLLAQAVWTARRLSVRYDSWRGIVERTLEPLGLVLKGGVWYLVARVGGGGKRAQSFRTYRVSNVLEAVATGETFARPEDFDLAAHWEEASRRFEQGLRQETATLRLTDQGRILLRQQGGSVERDAAAAASPDGEGRWRVTLPVETTERATHQVLALGAEADVVAPAALRRAVAEAVGRMAGIYGSGQMPRARRSRATDTPR